MIAESVKPEVIIIGCGPAGISAAIQLKRQGIECITVFERSVPGGLLRNANLVENYPGFPNGISGKNLSGLFVSHFARFSIPLKNEEIISVAAEGKGYSLESRTGRIYRCDFLIVATGTDPVCPDIEIPEKALSKKIFFEVADIPRPENSRVCITGGGDCAFDYALNLALKGAYVHIMIRSDTDRTFDLLRERVRRTGKISVRYSERLENIEEKDNGILVHSENAAGIKTEIYDYILFAIGRKPSKPVYEFDFEKERQNDTIYEIGDVKNGIFRQTSIAVANGIEAAMKINFKLRGM